MAHKYLILSICAYLILLVGAIVFGTYNNPPAAFPVDTIVTIAQGKTLLEISEDLEVQHVVRSAFFFRMSVLWKGGEKAVASGDYMFKTSAKTTGVTARILKGVHGLGKIKVTIPEGSTVADIAAILSEKIPQFDVRSFLELAKGKEGYLFPDTYFLLSSATPQATLTLLSTTFEQKFSTLEDHVTQFGKNRKDVVIMASILEGEARQTETRRVVSGILWRRLAIGMPLQVDTAFEYINGKNSLTLTTKDLGIDSPYNTYKYAGLPPTPISNPGLDALVAAVTPIETQYLYFLTDKNGVMHYAKTLDEHNQNKRKYPIQ